MTSLNMASKDILDQLANKIAAITLQASSEIRWFLEEARDIFLECSKVDAPSSAALYTELQAQSRWIEDYNRHEQRHAQYRISLTYSLLPKLEDHDDLLYRFAKEILDGAATVGEILGVSRPTIVHWITVRRNWTQKAHSTEDNTEPELQQLSDIADGDDDIDYGDTDGAMTYKYDYF